VKVLPYGPWHPDLPGKGRLLRVDVTRKTVLEDKKMVAGPVAWRTTPTTVDKCYTYYKYNIFHVNQPIGGGMINIVPVLAVLTSFLCVPTALESRPSQQLALIVPRPPQADALALIVPRPPQADALA